MKYYIVSIVDCHFDYEFDHTIVVRATDDTIEEKLHNVAKNWYGEDSLESEEGVFENERGDVTTYISEYKEITEATFNEIKHFLGEL